MGCVNSKKTRRSAASSDIIISSPLRRSSSFSGKAVFGGTLEKIKEVPEKEGDEESVRLFRHSKKGGGEISFSINLKFGKLRQAEHVAAGWPAWLSAVASDAVEGWLPLRSEAFERLEKIGQGTYSSVYRARNIQSGQMVALKKVRFDNFQPESVRFMAREIRILRTLDHPNIMKLEGIITSKLSCSIYLVFEYMEHDLAGLLSNHDIKFGDAQIKCYMRQLLCGIEHFHSQGVIHRDIKTSNILVNNEGILKIADFGLANFKIAKNWQPLTSRVVTLWYRPPELLLGSTNYGGSVDLWSVGCVFAELFIGRPLLKGRTEVEQLHKIFKLCGTPPDEYWKRSKLPLAAMFKPHHPYESTLREKCNELPKTAVKLIETFLSIEPYKRGTASSALDSEYFSSRPYACDPSSLPKYSPNKEIHAKFREEEKRRKAGLRMRASGASRNSRKVRKTLQEALGANIYADASRRSNASNSHSRGSIRSIRPLRSSYDTLSEASQVSQVTEISQVDSVQSVPVIATPSDFVLAKRQKQDSAISRSYRKRRSRSQTLTDIEPTSLLHAGNLLDSNRLDDIEMSSILRTSLGGYDKISKRSIQRQQSHPNRLDILDPSELYPCQGSSEYNDQLERGRFSGPLIQLRTNDESQEYHSHQAVRRSRLYEE